jgi:hypothetical protein
VCLSHLLSDLLFKIDGFGLWCLTPLSTIFQLYRVAVSFIGGGNLEYLEKITDLPQITDKFYHIMFYTSP